jgi:hypothetical protein
MTISGRFAYPSARPRFAVAVFILTCFCIAELSEFMSALTASSPTGETAMNRNLWLNEQEKDQRLRADLASKIVSEVDKHAAHIEASMQRLDDAVKAGPHPNVFDAVHIALPLPSDLMQLGDGGGQSKRARIGLSTLRSLDNCVAFVAGVNYMPTGTDSTGDGYPPNCRVHTFDCTMEGPRLAPFLELQRKMNPKVIFHPWCIGSDKSTGQDISVGEKYQSDVGRERKMYSLHQLMGKTNITDGVIDSMQFDIEGYEWDLLEDVIIKPALKTEASGTAPLLPQQLAFELHTEKANPRFVSPELTAGRDSVAVARLFRQLASIGYYVISKEINSGDKECAEFVLAYTKTARS